MAIHLTQLDDWILLRGLSREQRHWGEFYQQLQQTFPDKRFHCLDLPGTGDGYQQSSPASVAAIRRYLQQQCKDRHISQPYGLIGLSLGGMITLDWMHATDQVAAVVVINTSANNFSFSQRLRPGAFWLCLRTLLCPDVETRERLILRMGSRQHAMNQQTIAQWVAIQKARPVKRRTVIAQSLAAARFSLPDNPFETPGLVLTSDSDEMVSSYCSERIAARYHWPLRCHIEAGHDLSLDDPVWVVQQIKNWLEGAT